MRRLCRVPSRDVGDMGGAFSEVSEVGIEPDSRAMRPTKRKRFRQVKLFRKRCGRGSPHPDVRGNVGSNYLAQA